MSTPERDLIVGGQAVIEGVMMRTPNAYAIAVRKADGTIVNTAARLPKWSDKYPLLKARLNAFRHSFGQPPHIRRAFEEAMGIAK